MEQAYRFYDMGRTVSPGMRVVGKRSFEWDLNDWKWDGDLFLARPSNLEGRGYVPIAVNHVNSPNSSSSFSDEGNPTEEEQGRREFLERKRRVVVIDEGCVDDEAGNLTLKLGGFAEREVGDMGGIGGKNTKIGGGGSLSRAVCQVDDCGAELGCAKDYHRRHKVCEIHSKAGKALVGNLMQRFCQQCSRFHVLQEFDEGKRSCRRRLAGHNKRRRKTQPEPAVSVQPSNDEQGGGLVLISLLKLLSSMHVTAESNILLNSANYKSDQTTDQDMVNHLLRSLGGRSGSLGGKDLPGLLHESQKLLIGNSEMTSASLSRFLPAKAPEHDHAACASEPPMKAIHVIGNGLGKGKIGSSQKPTIIYPEDSPPVHSEVLDSSMGTPKLNNFDLNDVYVDSDDGVEDLERSPAAGNSGTGSLDFPSWARQDSQLSSPPHVSGSSDSASAQSPSCSSGEAQSRTDRIVFKLFGKEPNEFPILLRSQILGWLAHSPTEIESYIRPGCIVLTIYLRLSESFWEELCSDLSSILARLLDISNGTFWSSGWVCTMVQHRIALANNGMVVADTLIPDDRQIFSRIYGVKPIAVSISEQVEFEVSGYNVSRPSTRLLCAVEGQYLVQEDIEETDLNIDTPQENVEIECITLSCSISAAAGRGFIEAEDHGLSCSFFPFIVAEKDVCHEIRMLETVFESAEVDQDVIQQNRRLEAKREALDFIHEIGWLLHRSHLKSRLGHHDPSDELFSFKRFKWIIEYSMEHDWCAVVKKLLDIFIEGTVGVGEYPSLRVALSEMGLLHRAVRRNCRPLVELLLRYVPQRISEEFGYEDRLFSSESGLRFLFRPDAAGPAGLTPLHIAAGRDESEDVLDTLTDDPAKIGIATWKKARDYTGSTPEDYARLRGHYTYIHLVQKKINKISAAGTGSVVLNIPEGLSDASIDPKQPNMASAGLEIENVPRTTMLKNCKLCVDRKVTAYGRVGGRSLVYRPAMLSMVTIAAVCVCVALLFKTLPEIVCVFEPFRWELLDYGSS